MVIPSFLEAVDLPSILLIYIIPTILFAYLIESLLDRIRIFHTSSVNWIISIMIAFSSLYFIKDTYSFITGGSIFFLCVFKIGGIKGFLIGIAVTFIYFAFILPFLLKFI